MTYFFAGLEPFAIGTHNEEVLREVSKLRLVKQLRQIHQRRSGRRLAVTIKRMLLLPTWGWNALKNAIL